MGAEQQKPAFRQPWTYGAAAYYQADTFAAALEGFKRKRKPIMFHMPNDGEAGDEPCSVCGHRLRDLPEGNVHLKPNRNSSWYYVPRLKEILGGSHYECSWTRVFTNILALRRAG